MDEFDDSGWSHIHHAANNGYQKSISRFVRNSEDQLELLTKDGNKSTPLLLACASGNVETVRFLVELGANVNASSSLGHGVVELSSLAGNINVLQFLLESDKVNVFKSLVSGLDIIHGVKLQISCLKSLCELSSEENFEHVFNSGAIQAVLGVLDSPGSKEEAVINSLYFLEKILHYESVKDTVIEKSSNSVQIIVELLNSNTKEIYFLASKLLTELARGNRKVVKVIARNKGIEKLLRILNMTPQSDDVLLAVPSTLMLFCEVDKEIQNIFTDTAGSFSTLIRLLRETKRRKVLAGLARMVAVLVQGNHRNQDIFVAEDGIGALIPVLVRSRPREMQMSAVLAVKAIAADGSKVNQDLLQRHGCVKILTKLLREGSRLEEIREMLGDALWAIAGTDPESRYTIAKSISINILIEFLKASSENLNFIGSEALVVLAEDIRSKQDEIVKSSATQFLVRLIGQHSTPTATVLSIFRVFRGLCMQLGLRPHLDGQRVIMAENGIKVLVRYLIHSRNLLVQAKAAHTLSCVALGNPDTNTIIVNLFSFSHLVSLMSDMHENDVRLTAGTALALFAFNNVHNQKDIAKCATLHYSMFTTFLEDGVAEMTLAHAAFQVVVLARVFPDEDQASTSATGIKLLVRLLASDNADTQATCANFIAALAHTRPGIPAALVSIGTIYKLAKLLPSPSAKVVTCAAIALGYLSLDNSGQRQLLNVCRANPALYDILYMHARKVKLSQDFIERWKHYKSLLCLPRVRRAVCMISSDEQDEAFTIASHLNENMDDSDDESISEKSETTLPLLLQQ